jgi:prepilin-type N-terminal cleavage/methylation domain-containing protein
MSLKLKKIMKKRKGFTLLEVLFAALALAIVTTMLFSITTSAHLTTLNITGKIVAQNIAQATLEDIKAQNNFTLDTLIAGTPCLPNYPVGTSGGTADGATYRLKTSAPIFLEGITNSSPDVQVENGKISLFNYTSNAFDREITITKLPTNLPTDPESYNITINITWKLNSTVQTLKILGTKN